MKLTHRQIEVFRALMLTGHATRAAERLHTSQPTISRELARLEQVLGLTLFDRIGGRLRPTARALALQEEVERSFVGLERIAATAASLRDFAEGRLALACLPALSQALLPDAVRRFVAAWPRAGVSIRAQESPLLERELSEQRHDLGLTERLEAPPATRSTLLLEADEVAVLPTGHPLLAHTVLQPQDFADQPFVSFAPTDPYRPIVDALFAQAGVTRQLALEADSAAACCALVRQGLGLAIVNPLTALEWSGAGLQLRPLTMRVPFSVALVEPTLRVEHPLRGAFVAALKEAAGALRERLGSAVGT
ncbi:MAG: LysR family transcriptional regulator [Burkholderiaceae bacterium]|nr:LysR family transcriptional regulator [Burkholderiaceae bacterium]